MSATGHALAYVRRGWPVLPLNGKLPVTPNGVKDATTDPDLVRRWFADDALNVGIACGAPGPTVLDIDAPARAPQLLAELDAPTVATARGQHLYFAGIDTGTRRLDYGELRARGSYVVAPPSIHPSGKFYTWTATPDGKLPPVPADLVPAALAPEWRPAAPVEWWIAAVRHGFPDGQLGGEGRKLGLSRIAGHLLARRVDVALVLEIALLVNTRNRPPLPEQDVERVVRTIARRELAKGARDDR